MRKLLGIAGALAFSLALAVPARADEGVAPTARFGLGVGIPYGMAGINTEVGLNIIGLKVSAVGGIGAMLGQDSHKVAMARVVGVRAGLALGVVEPRMSLMYGTVGYIDRIRIGADQQQTVSMESYTDWAAGIGMRVRLSKSAALEADVFYTPATFDGAQLRDGFRLGNGTVKGAIGLSMGF